MSNAIQNVANGATGSTIVTGVASAGFSYSQWVVENVIVITVTCTILSLLLALVFNIINATLNHKHNKFRRSEDVKNIIAEALKQYKEEQENAKTLTETKKDCIQAKQNGSALR